MLKLNIFINIEILNYSNCKLICVNRNFETSYFMPGSLGLLLRVSVMQMGEMGQKLLKILTFQIFSEFTTNLFFL